VGDNGRDRRYCIFVWKEEHGDCLGVWGTCRTEQPPRSDTTVGTPRPPAQSTTAGRRRHRRTQPQWLPRATPSRSYLQIRRACTATPEATDARTHATGGNQNTSPSFDRQYHLARRGMWALTDKQPPLQVCPVPPIPSPPRPPLPPDWGYPLPARRLRRTPPRPSTARPPSVLVSP